MMTWRNCGLIVSGITLTTLLGPAMALPLSSDDTVAQWWESSLEQATDRQPPTSSLLPEVKSSPQESSLKIANGQPVSSQLTTQPNAYRQANETDTTKYLTTPLHDSVDGKPSANPQAFWRDVDQSKHPMSSELPREIAATIDDLQRGIAGTIADATGMRVDSEGRRRLSVGGVEVFIGPQGGSIAINHGNMSQTLVDYDAKRSDLEMAMLAEQDASSSDKVSFNPLIQLIQWLREILSYPLFWVFIATLVFGYIAAMIIRGRNLKRAQELYARVQHPLNRETERPRTLTYGKHSRPSSTARARQPTNETSKKGTPPEQLASVNADAAVASPTAVKQMPTSHLRTGSIRLKR